MYPLNSGYNDYKKPNISRRYQSYPTKLKTKTKPNTRKNMKNTSYNTSNCTSFDSWQHTKDEASSDTNEDANNASSDTATFDTPKNLVIRIDTVIDNNTYTRDPSHASALTMTRNASSSTCASSSTSGSTASSSSSSASSNSSSSSSGSTSSSASSCEDSSETTFISFPDEVEENRRIREKLMDIHTGNIDYSGTKHNDDLSTNTVSITNSPFLAITPDHMVLAPSIEDIIMDHHNGVSHNTSMRVSPSSNIDSTHMNSHSLNTQNNNNNNNILSPPDTIECDEKIESTENSTLSAQKFIFKFSERDKGSINPFRISNSKLNAHKVSDPTTKSVSASTNTKVKIYRLAHTVEMLTNKMNHMEEEWQRKEHIYQEKIAKLNKKKQKKKQMKYMIDSSEIEAMKHQQDEKENERLSESACMYGLDIAYNLAEAIHNKRAQAQVREEQLKEFVKYEFTLDFYKNYCPKWLNERWIRVMFLWIIIIWMLSNVIVTIQILINYCAESDNTESSIIDIWKLYELSTIYIWLQIFFILTLSIVSIYWESKYFVNNPKENTWIRIVLMSVGAIVLLCNLSGTVFKLLSDGNWMKIMIGKEYENIIKYTNYFVINVLSILIAILCISMIVQRIYVFYKKPAQQLQQMFLKHNTKCCCYNNNVVIKCVCCILICDILIFIESMYTFNDNLNDVLQINHVLGPLLTICIDSFIIFVSLFMIHLTLMYHYIDYELITNRSANHQISNENVNTLLWNEYKRITFYDSLQLIICLSPIADLITDSWTVYIYFATPNESVYALCALLILLIAFRFHVSLWLSLKRRNANFIFNSFHSLPILILIWLCWNVPFLSLFTNCLIHHISVLAILLSITNEIILFFAPLFAPFIIMYQSAKDFIITFILIKFKRINHKSNINDAQVLNHILDTDTNSFLCKLNDVFADEYQLNHDIDTKQKHLIIVVRCLKRIGAAFPMFILQTFVLLYQNHFNNGFRVTQYVISISTSLLIIIHSICWYHRNRII